MTQSLLLHGLPCSLTPKHAPLSGAEYIGTAWSVTGARLTMDPSESDYYRAWIVRVSALVSLVSEL